jgi:FRG domain
MNGYWTGPYVGSNVGRMVVEIDDMETHFEGCAYAYDSNPSLPSTFAIIKTSDKSNRLQLKAQLCPLHPQTGEPVDWSQIANLYSTQDIKVSKEAEIEGEWGDDRLVIKWKTDIGTFGSADLPRGDAGAPSTINPLPVVTWEKFKEHVIHLEPYRYIFRGQTNTWRLRTPFHRTGRGDMRRFLIVDVPTLHRNLSARTSHLFDLMNPLQNAAFLHLVQHHGYPTPLLDWTYSPFVAAYFAYHRIKSSEAAIAGDQKVRVFVFDKKQWCIDFPQILNLAARWEHFSILEPIALGNERLIPQQALSSFTTVDDIETYIRTKEETAGKRYLQVIDLPLRERDHIIRELRMMGITAGSLFPGLDGACEELKDRFFRL